MNFSSKLLEEAVKAFSDLPGIGKKSALRLVLHLMNQEEETTEQFANALPQALILTAIVIGFALLSFIFVLFYRAYQALGTADTESIQVAEADPIDNLPESNPKCGRSA